MTQVSREVQHRVSLMIGSIPAEVGAEEVNDRVVQADGLLRQSGQARTPAERKRLAEQAQRVLGARPRAQTEQIVIAKMAKSRIIGDPVMAEALVQQARDALAAHPPAIRRWTAASVIRKAAAAGQLLACFDEAGDLFGVCDPADVELVDAGDQRPAAAAPAPAPGQPVVPGGMPPAPAVPVAKAPAGQPKKAIFDAEHRLIGTIAADLITPVVTSLPANVKAIEKARGRAISGTHAARARPKQVIKDLGADWMPARDWTGRLAGAVRRSHVTPLPAGQVLKGAAAASRANVYDARRRRVGTARLADIIPLAGLTGRRSR